MQCWVHPQESSLEGIDAVGVSAAVAREMAKKTFLSGQEELSLSILIEQALTSERIVKPSRTNLLTILRT